MKSIKINLFSPNIAFPIAYSIYFLLGTTGMLGYAADPENLTMGTVQRYALIGLVCYFLGQMLVKRNPSVRLSQIRISKRTFQVGLILVAFGFLSLVATIVNLGSVPMFNVASRQQVSGYLSFLANLIWIGGLVMIVYELDKPPSIKRYGKAFFYYAVVCGLLLLLAFRTPIVLLTMALGIYMYMKRRIGAVFLGVAVLVLLIFGVWFWRYRYVQQYGTDMLSTLIGLTGLGNTPIEQFLGMIYLGFFRTSSAALTRLIDVVPSSHAFYYGKGILASWLAMLPGHQLSTREIIAALVTGINPPSTSYTATILGVPFLDFGLIGIILFMFLTGFLFRFWYEKARSQNSYNVVIYSFIYAVFILSIHSGLADPIFYFFTPLLITLAYKRIRFLPDIESGRLPSAESQLHEHAAKTG